MRRGRFEIVADILSIATETVGKTRIMYRANISYSILTRSLNDLQKRRLIECIREEDCILYRTTEKGRMFLNSFRMLDEILQNSQPLSRS